LLDRLLSLPASLFQGESGNVVIPWLKARLYGFQSGISGAIGKLSFPIPAPDKVTGAPM
jgi:hypothetical protein